MKVLLINCFLLTSLVGCSYESPVEVPPLAGVYFFDSEKTIAWMTEAKHPLADGPDWEYWKDLLERSLLRHEWKDGAQAVFLSEEEMGGLHYDWVRKNKDSYAKESDSDMLLMIISEEGYFVEMKTKDGGTIREYFIRRPAKEGNQGSAKRGQSKDS